MSKETQRTAVIFLDGDAMKVVFGRSVKELSASKIKDERAFFERLFKEYRVVVVERAVEVRLDQLMEVESLESATRTEVPAEEPLKEPPAKPKAAPSKERWIKSTSRTTLVIDDLPTGTEVAPGIPLMFSVPHDRAVSLATVSQEAVKKSAILERLLANGTLEWVSPQEAAALEMEHSARVAEENDARLQQWAPILDGVKATDYASDPAKRFAGALVDAPSRKDDPVPVDVNPDEASEQEELASMVQESKPQVQEAPKAAVQAPAKMTMTGLMAEIDQAEKDGVTRTVERRKVTNAAVIEGANPRGISRRE